MGISRRFLLIIFCFILILSFPAASQAVESGSFFLQEYCVNPIYADTVTFKDLQDPTSFIPMLLDTPEYTKSVSEAASVLRNAVKTRQETISVYIQTEGSQQSEETVKALIRDIAQEAMVHTGDPLEGDYLLWQFAGWKATANGAVADDFTYWTITYTFTYYSSAQDEALLSEKVTEILDDLQLSHLTPYQQISRIYDYICSHVTYDSVHKNDPSYYRQFTACGALVDGTAVCQGYALAFYRLALSCGLDCRLIPGTAGNENHGWNIVKIDHLYYNLDCTWDAQKDTYENFLKSQAGFRRHRRQSDYDTGTFHINYPMSPLDYVPTGQDLCEHSFSQSQVMPNCTEPGYTDLICTFCSYTIRTELTDPNGHSWSSEPAYIPPTQTLEGSYVYPCTVCDAVRTELIPAQPKLYRVYGSNRYETAFQIADLIRRELRVEKFPSIVIASGSDFADALSGSYLAIQKNAPILLANHHKLKELTDYIYENAEPGCEIYILGGENAVSFDLDTLLEDTFRVIRLAGKNRYETNLRILEAAGCDGKELLVSTGRNYADSLGAAALNLPILLVNQALTNEQKAILESWQGDQITILGGEQAVSETIVQEISALSPANLRRIQGKNRYETSLLMAQTYFPEESKNTVLAYGHNFPDGICGGVLAHFFQAPLMITREQNADWAGIFAAEYGIATGAVLGGPGILSDHLIQRILNAEPISTP